jgi:hypothetical protein
MYLTTFFERSLHIVPEIGSRKKISLYKEA